MASRLDLSNQALAAVGADAIESLNETSLSAREVNRAFDAVVADLIEAHDWSFAIRRATLAGVVNDRPYEWLYAYAKPSDAASLLRIVWNDGAWWPTFGVWRAPAWDALGAVPYEQDGETIYTNASLAVLEYTTKAVTPDRFSAMFARAVVYELATRIAMPIRKDRAIVGDMTQFAAGALARARADDENRNPRIAAEYVSPISLARAGWPV